MKVLYTLLLSLFSLTLFSQNEITSDYTGKRSSLSFGVLYGGGSLLGADLEYLINDQLGCQIGGGYLGFGGGLNIHLKPDIRSSFISLQYWHQGFGKSFAQEVVASNFVFRGKRWLTFQLGLGIPIRTGIDMPFQYQFTPVILTYAIGAYIPL